MTAAATAASPARERADDTPDPTALSGWPHHAKERADVYHRPRTFPHAVARWRRQATRHVSSEATLFPAAAGLDNGETRSRLDTGITRLREVARALAALYGRSRLGNHDDPVDELVYIILSRRTREDAYQATFAALKRRFRTWDAVLRARRTTVERVIEAGGLAAGKAESLVGALHIIRERFGTCTLDPTRDWDDARLEAFLRELPGIDRKSAYCIMMYSLDRQVLPVDTHVGRVLTRLAPYRELGLDLRDIRERKDHRRLQTILAPLVPPNLRYSLHVNLIAHGRSVCRERAPRCEQCEIRRFCGFYRHRRQIEWQESTLPTVIDLFSGAGGLSLGFTRAGFRPQLAVDLDADALRTFGLNHPELPDDRLLCTDIRTLEPEDLRRRLQGRRMDVVIGAPPCQGFSHAGFRARSSKLRGYRAMGDERNYLFESMIEIILALRPRLVLMENVPGMQSARDHDRRFMEVAAAILKERGGYQTDLWRLNASAFGVPQHRARMFLVAASTARFPTRPDAEYVDMHGSFDDDALPPVCTDEAIADLPPCTAGGGEGLQRWPEPRTVTVRNRRRFLDKFEILSESGLLYNHAVRYHNPRDLELYALLRPGENSQDAIDTYGRDDLMRYRRDGFQDKFNRLPPDRPSKTIVAHLAKDGNGYIHPSQVRSISVREAARLQSFPDDYVFCGAPADQWVQLGNSVPPVLAAAIARSFLTCLR